MHWNGYPAGNLTWLEAARAAIGRDAWKRTGCWLHPGFMAVTLFEMKWRQQLPANSLALFIMDYFVASLTGQDPVTEPSCAGSSGVFDVPARQWNDEAIASLGLSRSQFPEVREADYCVGGLTRAQAEHTGLKQGTPVFAPIGDHQASFLGSVADRRTSVLVNVGTGAQVAVYTQGFDFALPVELRPCPYGGNLLSNVGLAGGWSYQVLEQFFQDVGRTFFEAESSTKLYETMNRMAATVPSGADGLSCEPTFSGTRLDPSIRGSINGLSPQNFSAAYLARAVLEGMGRSIHDGFRADSQHHRSNTRDADCGGKWIARKSTLVRNRLTGLRTAAEVHATPGRGRVWSSPCCQRRCSGLSDDRRSRQKSDSHKPSLVLVSSFPSSRLGTTIFEAPLR